MRSNSNPLRLGTYMHVVPIGLASAARLYLSYLATMLTRIIPPARRYHIEDFIIGESMLTVKVGDVRAHIRPKSEDLHVMTEAYEPVTSKWFKVEPGCTVVDVGAHIGRYTLKAARSARRVIAIEADPSNFSV